MRHIKRFFEIVGFIVRQIYGTVFIKKIKEIHLEDKISIGGAIKEDIREVYMIYAFFNDGKQLDTAKRFIYYCMPKKLIFCARDLSSRKIIGIELYYINKRDRIEKTIHQGFRGVLPEWQGKKIGTMITSHAANHFKNNHIAGISSRVSLKNIPSLKSNLNLGFRPVEKYFDNYMKEERYYLINPLDDTRHWNFLE